MEEIVVHFSRLTVVIDVKGERVTLVPKGPGGRPPCTVTLDEMLTILAELRKPRPPTDRL